MSRDPGLAGLFLALDNPSTPPTGLVALGANLTAWNPTTHANSVDLPTGIATITVTNLPVINPAALSTGRVLLLRIDPNTYVILGNIVAG